MGMNDRKQRIRRNRTAKRRGKERRVEEKEGFLRLKARRIEIGGGETVEHGISFFFQGPNLGVCKVTERVLGVPYGVTAEFGYPLGTVPAWASHVTYKGQTQTL